MEIRSAEMNIRTREGGKAEKMDKENSSVHWTVKPLSGYVEIGAVAGPRGNTPPCAGGDL